MDDAKSMQSLINLSYFSYGRSVMSPEEIVAFAKKAGLSHVALTDYHSLSGIPEFMKRCEDAGLMGIAGITLNVKDSAGSCGDIVLLAVNENGFQQIKSLLSSIGHITQFKEYHPDIGVPKDVLLSPEFQKQTSDCYLLDGFPGSFAEQELKQLPQKERTMGSLKQKMQSSDFSLSKLARNRPLGHYQAVYSPGVPSIFSLCCKAMEDVDVNHAPPVVSSLVNYASNDTQLVAAQQCFSIYAKNWLRQFASPEAASEWLIERYQNKVMPDPTALPLGLQGSIEGDLYKTFFAPYESTHSSKLKVEALEQKIPGDFSLDALVERHWPDLESILPIEDVQRYREQLDFEMSMIKKLNFENYFLNIYQVKVLCDQSKNALMLRGSAVSSLVMHTLGMTPIDPLKEGLLFARFLSDDRVDEPDVDMEFLDPPKMLRVLSGVFGQEKIANLMSDVGMKSAKLILDEAKQAMLTLYPLSVQQRQMVEAAHKRMTAYADPKSNKNKRVVSQTWESWLQNDGKRMAGYLKTAAAAQLVAIANDLVKGIYSSQLVSGGIVIIPEGVSKYFNVIYENDPKEDTGLPKIPFNKASLPYTGFIKYDLLANHSFKRLVLGLRNAGLPDDPSVQENDPSVGYVFEREAFLGVNQLNGWTGENLAKAFRPTSFNDLTALFALIRSADVKGDNEVIRQYVNGRKDPSTVNLPEPLRPVLQETYGVLLYEEQLMRLLTDVGRFTWTEADAFRSGLKKGRDSVIDDYEPRFIAQASAHFNSPVEDVKDWYQPFREKRGRFVFSKAHAVAYSRVALQQCWFKTYYPAHYAAEMYIDGKSLHQNKSMTLSMVIDDWKKVASGEWQAREGVKSFLNAVGKILVRELDEQNIGYHTKWQIVHSEIQEALNNDIFAPLLIEGESKELALQHWGRVRTRLESRFGSQKLPPPPMSNNRPQNQGTAYSAPAQYQPIAKGDMPETSDKRSLNELMAKEELPWLDWVMFGQLLPYLQKRGVLTIQREEAKSKVYVEHKFVLNDAKNTRYNILSPSTDPVKLTADMTGKLHTGMHQGYSGPGSPRITVMSFFKELCEKGLVYGSAASFPDDKSAHEFFKSWVLQSELRLDGVHNITPQQSMQPPIAAPLSLPVAREKAVNDQFIDCMLNGRGFPLYVAQPYLAKGLFSFCLKYQEKVSPDSKKPGSFYRMGLPTILANYRLVKSGEPLFAAPLPQLGYLSEGGHQNIYRDRSAQNKILRRDHGTNRVKGHFWGDVIQGSDVLWMGEGVFDSMAFNDLQNWLPTLAPDKTMAEPNCISLKSAGGLEPFLESLLDIKLYMSNKDDAVDFALSKTVIKGNPISLETLDRYKEYLSEHVWHVIHDRTQESEHMMQALLSAFKLTGMESETADKTKFVVHFCNQGQWLETVDKVSKFKAVTENALILHKGNVEHWLRTNDIVFMPDEQGQMTLQSKVIEKELLSTNFSKMSADEKSRCAAYIQQKMTQMTGARAFGSAFDDDPGGHRPDKILFNFCKLVGVPYFKFMAPNIDMQYQGKKVDLKDHNDYYRFMKQLHSDGQHELLHTLIDQYAGSNTYHHSKLPYLGPEVPALTHDVQNVLKRTYPG